MKVYVSGTILFDERNTARTKTTLRAMTKMKTTMKTRGSNQDWINCAWKTTVALCIPMVIVVLALHYLAHLKFAWRGLWRRQLVHMKWHDTSYCGGDGLSIDRSVGALAVDLPRFCSTDPHTRRPPHRKIEQLSGLVVLVPGQVKEEQPAVFFWKVLNALHAILHITYIYTCTLTENNANKVIYIALNHPSWWTGQWKQSFKQAEFIISWISFYLLYVWPGLPILTLIWRPPAV